MEFADVEELLQGAALKAGLFKGDKKSQGERNHDVALFIEAVGYLREAYEMTAERAAELSLRAYNSDLERAGPHNKRTKKERRRLSHLLAVVHETTFPKGTEELKPILIKRLKVALRPYKKIKPRHLTAEQYRAKRIKECKQHVALRARLLHKQHNADIARRNGSELINRLYFALSDSDRDLAGRKNLARLRSTG
jgi:hypothetical protein